MAQVKSIDDKDPLEVIPVTIGFGRLFSTPIDNVSVSISVIDGADTNVSNMLLGVHQLTDKAVTQLIRFGVNNATYLISVSASSGNIKYSLGAVMRVRSIG